MRCMQLGLRVFYFGYGEAFHIIVHASVHPIKRVSVGIQIKGDQDPMANFFFPSLPTQIMTSPPDAEQDIPTCFIC